MSRISPVAVISTALLAAVVVVSPCGTALADDDARRIVERAFETARANELALRDYVFHERIAERRLTKRGTEKSRGSRTWDVTLLDGSEYRRLIAIDDRPLYPKTAAKEQRKLDKQVEKMRTETPKQRRKRLARIEQGHAEGEAFLKEITKAFEFRLIGEEEIDGLATYVIGAEPKPGYRPPSREAKVLTKLRATLWISRDEFFWVKAEMETLGHLRWAMVFKLRKGATIRFKQRRLDDEVWVTDHWDVRIHAKVAFAYRYHAELTGSYGNFRRFTTDSNVTHGAPAR